MIVIDYLDWYNILVNELIGDGNIFLILAFLAIAFVASKYNIPNMAFIALLALFGLIMAKFFTFLLPIILLLLGLFIGWSILKIITR